jgi:predicted AAA+ superfamily ATPase
MKPWREVAIPNSDVLESKFLQSEFAADITAVNAGKASREYQDASAFFERTYITEGMRHLLIQVAQRLNSKGGEPVIQLQTGFGGGKTHTMLAVFHLATRDCDINGLQGISELLSQGGLLGVPQAKVAVIDGNAHGPGQPWKRKGQTVKTLWGELAWQLGQEEGFKLVADSDNAGTSPGKETLQNLLEKYSPCVVLIDELVAYIRQFPDDKVLTGGTFGSNMSFVHALTEAVKLVPNAILLASLPESDVEAGGQRGVEALRALETNFARIQAVWKPVATEEAFEIVRRRLFEPVLDEKERAHVCRAFADMYISEAAKMPSETQESRYNERLVQAYPIHPEVFDRLFEDWTTIDGFQRTRGVLKLMAKVIYRLWKDDNKDLMILPSSLPLYDGNSRNELICYLPQGWDAVMEKDVDGDRAETTELENKVPMFGSINAARRVARTIFLGSAPSSVVNTTRSRGLDRQRILLGCVQPGQNSATFSDALNRLADLLHYLNSSGDKVQEGTRFWFDVRANLRREMEQRKQRFDKSIVRNRMADVLKKLATTGTLFGGVHPFTPHSDVPDDSLLRLVLLDPEAWYSKDESRLAFELVSEYTTKNGTRPRYKGNRLIFLAADHGALARLRDCILVALSWNSIVEDEAAARLVLDTMLIQQAKRDLQIAEEVIPKAARECYKWLLCPVLNSPSETKETIEPFQLNTSGSSLSAEIERVCSENELVISVWSPIHLRDNLIELYWKGSTEAVLAMTFWEDSLKYLYLPRLKNKEVLSQAIVKGAGSIDFFGTAYGQHDGRFDGFKLGDANVQLDDTLLLIEPGYAKSYADKLADELAASRQPTAATTATAVTKHEASGATTNSAETDKGKFKEPAQTPDGSAKKVLKTFHTSVPVNSVSAKVRLVQLVEEIISVLASDPQAEVRVTLEVNAEFPAGVSEQIRRAVSLNGDELGIPINWE